MDSIQTSLLLKMWVVFEHFSIKWFSPYGQAQLLVHIWKILQLKIRARIRLTEVKGEKVDVTNYWTAVGKSGLVMRSAITASPAVYKTKGAQCWRKQNVFGFAALFRSDISLVGCSGAGCWALRVMLLSRGCTVMSSSCFHAACAICFVGKRTVPKVTRVSPQRFLMPGSTFSSSSLRRHEGIFLQHFI